MSRRAAPTAESQGSGRSRPVGTRSRSVVSSSRPQRSSGSSATHRSGDLPADRPAHPAGASGARSGVGLCQLPPTGSDPGGRRARFCAPHRAGAGVVLLPAVLDGPPRAGGDRPAHARDWPLQRLPAGPLRSAPQDAGCGPSGCPLSIPQPAHLRPRACPARRSGPQALRRAQLAGQQRSDTGPRGMPRPANPEAQHPGTSSSGGSSRWRGGWTPCWGARRPTRCRASHRRTALEHQSSGASSTYRNASCRVSSLLAILSGTLSTRWKPHLSATAWERTLSVSVNSSTRCSPRTWNA